jgi:predicted small metal-binding protein
MSRLPSPPSEEENARPRSRAIDPVPLNSSIRTTPIHPQLPEIRVPQNNTIPSTHYHPVTCEPLNIEEIQPQLQHLRKEHPSITAMRKVQEDAVKEIKQKLKEKDKKRDEVQKKLDTKAKEWDMEYRVISKYLASKS